MNLLNMNYLCNLIEKSFNYNLISSHGHGVEIIRPAVVRVGTLDEVCLFFIEGVLAHFLELFQLVVRAFSQLIRHP